MLCSLLTPQFATFQQYYSKHELSHVSGSTISWIGAIQFAFCPMFGCVSGPLFDAGYLRHLILVSGFLYVFCLMMASLATEYYQLLLSHGFGVGLAMGLVFAPSVATLSHHFAGTRFRILAYGTQASGSAVAGIFFPAMLNHLLPRYGFAWAMRILGFTVLGFFVVIFFTLSTTVPPRKKIAVLSFSVFQNKAYCLYVAGVCLVSLSLFNPLTFGVTYAVYMGVPFETASYAPAINNGVSIIGRIIPLIAAQKVGPINILGSFAIGTGVLQLLWTLAKSTAGIMTYDAIYGIVAGGYAAAINPGAASFAPQTNQSGLYLGMCFFMSSFFWLVGTPISAALIDKNPTYLGASLFGGSVCVLGGISVMLCTIWRRRQLGTPWV
ncbi:hypothetical protein VHUM_04142 [Vanrija humicola]|uniref:Major facilitator superfamily (MFS) profile domain-containing protein n=1 Tax=Vanrija humicola TaxID=5417 RepID=A0A7D8UWA3_VANHU|nr:hypothetical protein VHUM_04142 [Vanrija humicola]